jgi:EAL domain-containing protein (putative c-di-GMP-specific phosphodiesterase class I)
MVRPAENQTDMFALADDGAQGESMTKRALRAMRRHLGLQVAYVSEFVGDMAVFREVDAPRLEHLIKPGDERSLDDVYCRHILAGRLPQLISDTARYPLAAAMPITAAIPIGAHVSVPLVLPDGEAYGMFCCLGPAADDSLNPRDLAMMKSFAELTAFEIARERQASREMEATHARIREVIAEEQFSMAFQPIWSIAADRPVGFEALSRFASEPVRSPDVWFAEAEAAGLGSDLELAAIHRALNESHALPAHAYIALNASPATIAAGNLGDIVALARGRQIVLEITEHAHIDDYASFAKALAPLRAQGVRLAIDDAGAGYSSLRHILQLTPDLIKLDRALVAGIGLDRSRRAMVAALLAFARETAADIIAEGVETASELVMLRSLGIDLVQGYHLGRPVSGAETFHKFGDRDRSGRGRDGIREDEAARRDAA